MNQIDRCNGFNKQHTHTHIDYLLLLWTASHAYSISTTANKSMEMFEMSASVTEHRSKLLRH